MRKFSERQLNEAQEKENDQRLHQVINNAEQSFWRIIAQEYDLDVADLSYEDTHQLSELMKVTVKKWVENK